MKKNLLSIVIILLAISIVILNLWKPTQTEEEKEITIEEDSEESKTTPVVNLSQPQEGHAAPDFELTTLKGKTVKLSDYKGKKLILNFWATWCPPCKAEMPHMQNFYEQHNDKGIEILAVNLTNIDRGQEAIETFVNDYGLTFPIPLDKNGSIGSNYQAFTIPTSYIIDSDGIITKKIVGPMNEDMMLNLTKEIK